MTEHDESLEIGIAAGLDIPTAMVISERHGDDGLPRKGCSRGAAAIVIALILLGSARWLPVPVLPQTKLESGGLWVSIETQRRIFHESRAKELHS